MLLAITKFELSQKLARGCLKITVAIVVVNVDETLVNLLNSDYVFRFQISSGKVAQIVLNWIKFTLIELSILII